MKTKTEVTLQFEYTDDFTLPGGNAVFLNSTCNHEVYRVVERMASNGLSAEEIVSQLDQMRCCLIRLITRLNEAIESAPTKDKAGIKLEVYSK